MVGIPCYTGKIHLQTMRCLMADAIQLMARKDQFMFAEDIGNSDIAGSRAMILATFYRSDADVLVFIDDDVIWQTGDMVRLIDYPVDLVGGIYPKKTEESSFPIRAEAKEEYRTDPETGLVEVTGLPGGFMKISRKCVEEMVKAYPRTTKRGSHESSQFWPVFDPYELPDGDRLSEDFSFCQRYRDIGGKVWANFEFDMGHIGYKTFKGSLGNYLRASNSVVK